MGSLSRPVSIAAMACVVLASASASADAPQVTANVLMTRDLAGVAGKEVVISTVEYVPGGASMPHRHDANVFVYVLQGSFTTQVDGGEKVTLGPGQMFYESPTDVHRVSANGSRTQPAKILVFMVKDRGKPGTRPVDTPSPR